MWMGAQGATARAVRGCAVALAAFLSRTSEASQPTKAARWEQVRAASFPHTACQAHPHRTALHAARLQSPAEVFGRPEGAPFYGGGRWFDSTNTNALTGLHSSAAAAAFWVHWLACAKLHEAPSGCSTCLFACAVFGVAPWM